MGYRMLLSDCLVAGRSTEFPTAASSRNQTNKKCAQVAGTRNGRTSIRTPSRSPRKRLFSQRKLLTLDSSTKLAPDDAHILPNPLNWGSVGFLVAARKLCRTAFRKLEKKEKQKRPTLLLRFLVAFLPELWYFSLVRRGSLDLLAALVPSTSPFLQFGCWVEKQSVGVKGLRHIQSSTSQAILLHSSG